MVLEAQSVPWAQEAQPSPPALPDQALQGHPENPSLHWALEDLDHQLLPSLRYWILGFQVCQVDQRALVGHGPRPFREVQGARKSLTHGS